MTIEAQFFFFNDFPISNFKRFYVIQNFSTKVIRAWHGHLKETKFMICLSGAFKIAAVDISSNPNSPDKNARIYSEIIDEHSATGFLIPKGYANGSIALLPESKLWVFSTATLDESKSDDYRYNFDYWNPWTIENR